MHLQRLTKTITSQLESVENREMECEGEMRPFPESLYGWCRNRLLEARIGNVMIM